LELGAGAAGKHLVSIPLPGSINRVTSTLSRDERVRLDRTRSLFGHPFGNFAGIVAGSLLIAAVLRAGGAAATGIAWWALLLAATGAAMVRFERHVARIGISAHNCDLLAAIHTGIGAAIALCFGIAVFLMPDPVSPVHNMFLFAILSTVATLTVLRYALTPTYYLTLTMAALMPLTAHIAYQYLVSRDAIHLVLIAGSLLWQLIVLAKAKEVSRAAIDAVVFNMRLQDEIAEHRRTRDAIRELALHDELTGLANRRALDETLARTLSQAERSQAKFGLVTVDIDDFKAVNDERGRAVGDALLKAVAGRLQASVRAGDFCARTEGNDFVIIVGSVRAGGDAGDIAAKLRKVFDEPFVVGESSLPVSASVGWASYPEDGTSAAQIMAMADKRLMVEKRANHAASIACLQEPALANLTGLS
jgi:diguanylate cyclase (GGDEF)-like protein